MNITDAISLIKPGVSPKSKIWADIGAGTGLFTRALAEILGQDSTVYAVDKSPHALWDLAKDINNNMIVVEGDFNNMLDIPQVDSILMANALHYAGDPEAVLRNVLSYLKPGGTILLVEYETSTPRAPWVPYPVPFARFEELSTRVGLSAPTQCGRIRSQYGYEFIYAACASLQFPVHRGTLETED